MNQVDAVERNGGGTADLYVGRYLVGIAVFNGRIWETPHIKGLKTIYPSLASIEEALRRTHPLALEPSVSKASGVD